MTRETPPEARGPTAADRPVEVSVLIPVKDEAENIPALAREVTAAFTGQPFAWECVWVDDGSGDGSLAILEALHTEDPRHRFISFEKNAGQSAALFAGFCEAGGAVIATIDGDGQNDPADLPALVAAVRSGRTDMANGYRAKRRDTIGRKIASRVGNGLRNLLTGKTVRDVGCSTRAFRRECMEHVPLFKGMHRFLPTLAAMRGFRLSESPVGHRPRVRGKTKYTVGNRLWVGLTDIFGILWLRRRTFTYRAARRSAP